jgi:hypothetical protein
MYYIDSITFEITSGSHATTAVTGIARRRYIPDKETTDNKLTWEIYGNVGVSKNGGFVTKYGQGFTERMSTESLLNGDNLTVSKTATNKLANIYFLHIEYNAAASSNPTSEEQYKITEYSANGSSGGTRTFYTDRQGGSKDAQGIEMFIDFMTTRLVSPGNGVCIANPPKIGDKSIGFNVLTSGPPLEGNGMQKFVDKTGNSTIAMKTTGNLAILRSTAGTVANF